MIRESLGNLIRVHYGKALKANERDKDGNYPVYGSNGVVGYHNSTLVNSSTIIIGRKGSVGSIFYASKGGWPIDTAFYTEILDPKILDIRYLFYALRNLKLAEHKITTSIPGINRDRIYQSKVFLPSIKEQKRIAAILDKADAIRRKRQQAIDLTGQLLRSVFLDMFGDPVSNSKGWPIQKFGEVTKSRLGKMLDAKQQTGMHQHFYLRNPNVQWGKITLDNLLKMDFNKKDQQEFQLKYGDILICEGGEVGRAAIWKNEINNCYYQKALHRVRPVNGLVNSDYICDLMWFMAMYGGLTDYVSSATIAHLTGAKLKSMKILVPPIDLQNKYSEMRNKIEVDKSRLNLTKEKTENLFSSLTQRAFQGKL